jgi:sirohydrochlorin cobaltochelatase
MGAMRQHRPEALVLVGGHESRDGRALAALAAWPELLGEPPLRIAAAGRSLAAAIGQKAGTQGFRGPIVVVPMTLGRDPRLVADTARTVRWIARDRPERAIVLAEPFGTPDHLVSWLRAACRTHPSDTAILIAAPAADPFDDAELHRIAALVRVFGTHPLVEVALLTPGDQALQAGIERCRRLGADRVAVVPASFGTPAGTAGPLLAPVAVASVVSARVVAACRRLAESGEDGVDAALAADHQHGFAHAHDHTHNDHHGHTHDSSTTSGLRLEKGPAHDAPRSIHVRDR